MDLLADLTPAQREAVTHIEGPLLVLAGPGSGKTRVITRRVAYLLQQGVRPWNLLAITFTNKAAGEMRKRVQDLVPGSRVLISTFHSLGARLLRQYGEVLGIDRNFTIYDQGDRLSLVKEVLAQANIDNVHFSPDRVQGAISRAKNELKDPGAYAAGANDFFGQTVARVYPVYEQKLRAANALDFDDLLYLLAMLLRRHPEVRAELDARFRYVLIDEYQDTNYAQYVIAKGLAQDHQNLCVVGDPDQSIYAFRGSDIRNILDFERDFPTARTITLDKNYRSTQTILQAADGLIAHNVKRKPKRLTTDNPPGTPIQLLTFATGLEEAHGIARRIRNLVEEKGDHRYRDIAVFLRINALSRGLETAFIKQRVPYQMVRGLAFFERKENRDVLAYLRLLVNPQDSISFRRAVNTPTRGVGDLSLAKLEEYAAPRDLSLFAAACEVAKVSTIKGKAAKGLAEFVQLITGLQKELDKPAADVLRAVIERSGYRKMLQESKAEEDLDRLANIEELITAAHEFEEEAVARAPETEQGVVPAASSSLAAFLEQITLKNDVDDHDAEADQVAIMTLHAAKGLEFPVVFMPAVEQGILPHERAGRSPDELEEERRLAFVGITRAEKELILSHAKLREFRGTTLYAIPSPFLDELPQSVLQKARVSSDLDRFDEPTYHPADSASYPAPKAVTKPAEKRPLPPLQTAAALAAAPMPPRADADQFVVNATVRHRDYGVGLVREVSGFGPMKRVKVKFGSGERTFVLEKAPLEVVRRG